MKKLGPLALLLLLLVPGWAAPAAAATYEVRPGDSLYLIANRFGSTVDVLRVWNDCWGDYLYPGQKLVVPDRYACVVQPGDSLYLIGRRYGVDPWRLAAWNGLTGSDIYPGQVLAIPPPGSSQPVSRGASGGELDLLARLITAEADGEPYIAKVAVAAVVLNRVRSPAFPNTIAGVIYDYRDGAFQFTPVMNG
ncbi:MAG: LysM peptidoglycan-binding domain-containing protein, partial [Firmicutes bacterium]|nr:LysM peptidoglycan-binding domain-containing protein [Bacillota bacterium]